MGMYTTLVFKGFVKEEFRESIDKVVNYKYDTIKVYTDEENELSEKWESTYVDFMMEFAKFPSADSIPSRNNMIWNKETGAWNFTTKLKNYDNTFDAFFNIVPLFMESIEICKTLYEEVDYYKVYELKEHRLIYVRSEDKFPELED